MLYTFWRSQAAYRVRIALALKGLQYERTTIDLIKGDQHGEGYRAVHPGGVLPTLIDGDGPPLVESLAILEYLEEKEPKPPLLPSDPRLRAHARGIAQMMVVDTHPYIVPRVRKQLSKQFGSDDSGWADWLRHWFAVGSQSVETLLARDSRTGKFCCGDQPTVADICLVPHLVSGMVLKVLDVSDYPTCKRVFDTCMELDAFSSTHPRKQPDFPPDH
jgi:maleylacetoacetate isomerase